MRTLVVTPPEPVVTWEEADDHLRLSGDTDQQALVASLIAAATAHIDGPAGWLGRSIGMQTLEARFSLIGCAPCIRLLYPPVVELVAVKYLNSANVELEADLADFELFGDELAAVSDQWPWIGGSLRREAVRVQYRAGYAQIPAPIRAAILLMVGDLYKFRETVSAASGTVASLPVAATVSALLQPYRVYAC